MASRKPDSSRKPTRSSAAARAEGKPLRAARSAVSGAERAGAAQDPPGGSGREPGAARTSARSTVSGPALPTGAIDHAASADAAVAKHAATEALAKAVPYNTNKPLEHGRAALQPQPGQSVEPDDPSATGSTLTESNVSNKVGSGDPRIGTNPTNDPLDRVRVDSGGRVLTTNQGTAVADNQNSLKAGLNGPALLEDFILREKITHFDHERIPERIVHARGSGAHQRIGCSAEYQGNTPWR